MKSAFGQKTWALSQAGFTLLEVMVALAILAVVAVTASQASRSYLNAVTNLKTRTLAHYIAQNTLADLRIQQPYANRSLTQPDIRQVSENGRQWQVTIHPQTLSLSLPLPVFSTNAANSTNASNQTAIIPIRIEVAPITEAGVQNSITSLDAVLVKNATMANMAQQTGSVP